MFKALAFSTAFDCAMICGYIVKVHRAGPGAKWGDSKPVYEDIVRRHHNLNTGAHRRPWKYCISIAQTMLWLT